MNELERLYFEKEQTDIKDYCIKHGQTIEYEGQTYFLYMGTIYDGNMNIVISDAENGFLDLFEINSKAILKNGTNLQRRVIK